MRATAYKGMRQCTTGGIGREVIMITEKLRSMQAHVEYWTSATVKLECYDLDEYKVEEVTINNPIVLVSYNSVVAIWDGFDMLYLLPRYDYSVTTWKQLHAFIEDFTWLPSATAREIRAMAKIGDNYGFVQAYRLEDNPHWYRY